MKKTLFYMTLLILSFSSCKSKDIKNNDNLSKNDQIQIEIKANYSLGENISIKITNISQNKIILYNPTKKNIQKKVDGIWKNLRILPCPCDAPCKAPPEKIDFPSNQDINLRWNQKESYCGKKIADAKIRETIYKNVDKGIYRYTVVYQTNNQKKTIYKEFKIN